MINLPRCIYPGAADTSHHGIQSLAETLPLIYLQSAQKFRSKKFATLSIHSFDSKRILELSRFIANSFAKNRPMNRHLQPPKEYPQKILNLIHTNPFGSHSFGPWALITMVPEKEISVPYTGILFSSTVCFIDKKGLPLLNRK